MYVERETEEEYINICVPEEKYCFFQFFPVLQSGDTKLEILCSYNCIEKKKNELML